MSTVSAFTGQHFAFASGRTGVLRQSLITQADIDRMLGSHDLPALEKILTELKFTDGIDQGVTGTERILQHLETWVVKEVEMMVPKEKLFIFNLLWVTGDAPLLAWLLKASRGLTAQESKEPSSGLHAFTSDDLKALVATGKSDRLPKEFLTLVTDVQKLQEPTARLIDTLTEKAVATFSLSLAKKSRSTDIVRFVRTSMDLRNIRTALRLQKENLTEDDAFFAGGILDPKELASSTERMRRAINSSDLALHLGKNLSETLGDPLLFERKAAEILANDIGRMWHVPLTVEPVFAFASIALSHIHLLRAIAIGKRSSLSPQDIKLILPPFIPASRFTS
jgi:vacuolar-type H+-ATPase subunit C/Vma6